MFGDSAKIIVNSLTFVISPTLPVYTVNIPFHSEEYLQLID
jgi:hypothetical protein